MSISVKCAFQSSGLEDHCASTGAVGKSSHGDLRCREVYGGLQAIWDVGKYHQDVQRESPNIKVVI